MSDVPFSRDPSRRFVVVELDSCGVVEALDSMLQLEDGDAWDGDDIDAYRAQYPEVQT